MGEAFSPKDIPNLEDYYVQLCCPLFTNVKELVRGQVRYVDNSSRNPKILYIKEFGVDYSIRVDVSLYEHAEVLGEDEIED